jgi:tetratricopeptide (TPR) repeat protein
MSVSARIGLALTVWLAAGWLPLQAQDDDHSSLFVPRRPQTRRELDRREALKRYVLGLVCQKGNHLLEAVRHFERALELDPDATPVRKALVPLYLVLERTREALAACRKVLQRDPDDYETWFLYARQLKLQGRLKEARAALTAGTRSPALKEHPDLLQQMYFELGVLCESASEYKEAVAAFGQAVRILEDPETLQEAAGPFDPREIDARAADLYERIGRLATLARQYDQAVAAFKKAQAKARDGAGRLNYDLADLCRLQGKYREAMRYLEAYLGLQPQGMEAYELMITLLRGLQRQAAIIPSLKEYAAKDRFNTGLKLLLAREYAADGQDMRAEAIYEELIKAAPTPEAYRDRFRLYMKSRRFGAAKVLLLLDKAVRDAGKSENQAEKTVAAAQARVMLVVLKDDTDLVKPLLESAGSHLKSGGKLEYDTCRFLAVLAGRARQLDTAERLYRKCLDDADAANKPVVYGGLLKVLWQARKYSAIVAVCRQGLRNNGATNHILFHLDLSLALPYLGKMNEALEHADQAVALASDDSRLFVRLRRVSVLTRAERYEKAVAECQALLKEYKQPADVHDIRYTLSNVYSAARDFPKAEAELERVLKDNPDDATGYNDLGYIWADQGKNLKQAEEYIRKAIDLDQRQKKTANVIGTEEGKDNAAYIDSLGWVLFRRGRLEDARRHLEQASRLPDGDDDPVVWDHLGDVYFRLDQPARARAAWQKAVALYEVEKRRTMDQRYKEVKEKLKTLGTETQP